MIDIEQHALFDYGALDTETRAFIQEKAQSIHTRLKRTAEDVIAIGQDLIAVKGKLGHGNFLNWITSEFSMSERTARDFMSIARKFGNKSAPGADLGIRILRELASASDTIIEMVESGQIEPTLTAIREARRELQSVTTPSQTAAEEPRKSTLPSFQQWKEDNAALGLDAFGDVLPATIPFTEQPDDDSAWTSHTPIEPTETDTTPPLSDLPYDDTETKEKRDTHVMRVMGSSDSPEWYTPQMVIDLVREMFGTVETDPCSNSHDIPAVPATTLYTKDDDGLAHAWQGKTYLNPPYGAEIGRWVNKLIAEYEQGNVTEALALLPARIDTVWFQPLYAHLMCNVRGRIQFANSPYSAPFPCVIAYLGPNHDTFIHIFQALGPIMKRVG